jgi:succinyl-CoA synthetase beta subunit
VDPNVGIQAYHLRQAAFGLNMPKACMKPFTVLLKNLYRLAVAYDCSLVEINPLVITAEDDRDRPGRQDGFRRQRPVPASRCSGIPRSG